MSLKGFYTETYILLASMVFFGSLGNVLLSRGMKQTGEIIDFSPSALAGAFVRVFTNGSIWLGIASLLVFFASYLLLLSWADFSYVQPASAIGYALVAVANLELLAGGRAGHADQPRQRWRSIRRTGPPGGRSRYCEYLAASSAMARSASGPGVSSWACPSSRTHQRRAQSSS